MAAKIVPAPDYEDRVRTSFARQKAMATIGAELTLVTPGIIEIEMPYSAALTQQHGFLHAGVISTALDSACGYAAFSLMPESSSVLTIEFKVNLLAPGRGEAATGEEAGGGCHVIVGVMTIALDGPVRAIE